MGECGQLTQKALAKCLGNSGLHRCRHWVAPGIRVSSSICRLCMHFPPPLILRPELPPYVLPNRSRSAYQLLLAQQPASAASVICLLAGLRIETVQRRRITTPFFLFHLSTVCCACCQCLGDTWNVLHDTHACKEGSLSAISCRFWSVQDSRSHIFFSGSGTRDTHVNSESDAQRSVLPPSRLSPTSEMIVT
jgi:hypothetical protein